MTQPCIDRSGVPGVPSVPPTSAASPLVPPTASLVPTPRSHLVVLPDVESGASCIAAASVAPPVAPVGDGVAVREGRWADAWEHRPLLLAMARQRVAPDIAEDVVSEALLRAATADLDGLGGAALRAWLVTTTLRLCADVHRRTVRDRRRDLRLAAYEPQAVPAPDDQVVDELHARWLAQQVERLPERQARALWLRAHGHDIGSIAATMVLPYKTVESLLSRGRHSIRGWAGGLLLVVGGWRTLAKRKAQLHVAAAAVTAAGDVTYDVARVATGLITRSF